MNNLFDIEIVKKTINDLKKKLFKYLKSNEKNDS